MTSLPPLLGYIRLRELGSVNQLPALRRRLRRFASREGYALVEILVEHERGGTSAFARLLELVSRNPGCKAVIPSLAHLAELPQLQHALSDLIERETGYPVLVLAGEQSKKDLRSQQTPLPKAEGDADTSLPASSSVAQELFKDIRTVHGGRPQRANIARATSTALPIGCPEAPRRRANRSADRQLAVPGVREVVAEHLDRAARLANLARRVLVQLSFTDSARDMRAANRVVFVRTVLYDELRERGCDGRSIALSALSRSFTAFTASRRLKAYPRRVILVLLGVSGFFIPITCRARGVAAAGYSVLTHWSPAGRPLGGWCTVVQEPT